MEPRLWRQIGRKQMLDPFQITRQEYFSGACGRFGGRPDHQTGVLLAAPVTEPVLTPEQMLEAGQITRQEYFKMLERHNRWMGESCRWCSTVPNDNWVIDWMTELDEPYPAYIQYDRTWQLWKKEYISALSFFEHDYEPPPVFPLNNSQADVGKEVKVCYNNFQGKILVGYKWYTGRIVAFSGNTGKHSINFHEGDSCTKHMHVDTSFVVRGPRLREEPPADLPAPSPDPPDARQGTSTSKSSAKKSMKQKRARKGVKAVEGQARVLHSEQNHICLRLSGSLHWFCGRCPGEGCGRSCAVCLDYLASAKCLQLPCGHIFHQSCVKALRNNAFKVLGCTRRCPVCRMQLTVEEFFDLECDDRDYDYDQGYEYDSPVDVHVGDKDNARHPEHADDYGIDVHVEDLVGRYSGAEWGSRRQAKIYNKRRPTPSQWKKGEVVGLHTTPPTRKRGAQVRGGARNHRALHTLAMLKKMESRQHAETMLEDREGRAMAVEDALTQSAASAAELSSFQAMSPDSRMQEMQACADEIARLQRKACLLAEAAWGNNDDSCNAGLHSIAAQPDLVAGLCGINEHIQQELQSATASGIMQDMAHAINKAGSAHDANMGRAINRKLVTKGHNAVEKAARAAMVSAMEIAILENPPGHPDRTACLATYESLRASCPRLKALLETECRLMAASSALPVSWSLLTMQLQAVLDAQFPETSEVVSRAVKVLELVNQRKLVALHISTLLCSIKGSCTTVQPIFAHTSQVKAASAALDAAVVQLRKDASKGVQHDPAASIRARNCARRSLISAMGNSQSAIADLQLSLPSVAAALQLLVDDLRILLHDKAVQLKRDTVELFPGSSESDWSDDMAQQIAKAHSQSASTHAVLINLRAAVDTNGLCDRELPRLKGWDASPPNIAQLQEARYELDDRSVDLRTAHDKFTTAQRQKRPADKLECLQSAVDEAKHKRRGAEACLDKLQHECLLSLGHFVEIATELAAVAMADDVPEGLMQKWHPHRHLSDFKFQEIPGGRHRLFKVECDDGCHAVVKEYPCVGNQRKIFFSQLQRIHDLRHPCVMAIQAIFIDGDGGDRTSFFVQMPFCSGGTLDNFIEAGVVNGTLRASDIRLLLNRVLRGVAHLHGKSTTHCDLKPSNILVDDQGVPKITDFETSRDIGASISMTRGGGTLGYIAPELHVVGAKPTMPSDMYSLGKVFASALPFLSQLPEQSGSGALNKLITQLTHATPSSRPTAVEAAEHSYFTTDAKEAEDLCVELLSTAEVSAKQAAETRQALRYEMQKQETEKAHLQQESVRIACQKEKVEEQLRRAQCQQVAVASDAKRNQILESDLARQREKLKEAEVEVSARRLEAELQRSDLSSKIQEAGLKCGDLERVTGKFEWLDEHGNWNAYSAEISGQIHVAASTGGICEFSVNGQEYALTTCFPMFQTNKKHATHRHVRLTGGSGDEAFLREPPLYWHPGTGSTEHHLLPLDRRNPHMKNAWDEVALKIHASAPNAKVVEVSVLQDPLRWKAYNMKRSNLSAKLAGGANERCLFHGTSEASTATIATQGFLREYNSTALYGNGTYFARDASYSARGRYTPPNSEGEKFMFLARVLVGEPCAGVSGMKKPAPKPGRASGELCESMVDRLQDPTIFILSAGSDDHAYAEFLVKFK
jgi:poly [ADP-ribose] polymerase 10/14/15